METYKKTKKSLPLLSSFLFIDNVASKITTEIIENHSEFFGCPNSCNKCVSSRSW